MGRDTERASKSSKVGVRSWTIAQWRTGGLVAWVAWRTRRCQAGMLMEWRCWFVGKNVEARLGAWGGIWPEFARGSVHARCANLSGREEGEWG